MNAVPLPATPGAHRRNSLLSALILAGLGLLFLNVLVVNGNDNAYLWVALIGNGLLLASVPFAFAAALPPGPVQRMVTRSGVVLVWLLGIFGTVLLGLGLVIVVMQRPWQAQVFVSHLAGLVLLVPSVLLVGYRLNR